LKVNLKDLKPEHFQGAVLLSDPQRQLLYLAHRAFGPEWVKGILEERKIEGVRFNEMQI